MGSPLVGTESKPAPLTLNGSPTPKLARDGPKSISAIAQSICVHRIATHDLRRLLACNGFSGIVVEDNAYALRLAPEFFHDLAGILVLPQPDKF